MTEHRQNTQKAPLLELRNVTVVREGTTILKEINWRVEKHEHTVILGANGSGKTTLLKVLTGLEWPTIGSVSVFGHVFGETNLGELRKRIGWVSSALAYQCKDEDSAGEIVLSGLDGSIGLWRDDFTNDEMKRAAEMLRLLGADRIVERAWGYLSQGERQRVLIARALVAQPEILILDEPCAGLDPVAREKILDDLGKFSVEKDSPTILFVTHHIEEIRPWISNAIALKNGLIKESGNCSKVLSADLLSDVFGSGSELSEMMYLQFLQRPE